MAARNNGDGNCGDRNAVKLFTQTSQGWRGSTAAERRWAGEHQNISPEIPTKHKPTFLGGQTCF